MSFESIRSVGEDGSVQFNWPHHAPCPCGREQTYEQCCKDIGVIRVPSSTTSPPPPQTGFSLSKCYAHGLLDCGKVLSREHYVSESLLHVLNENGTLTVGGLAWLKGATKVLTPSVLNAKVLCSRHNAALSSLDALASNFFRAFDAGPDQTGKGTHILAPFSGHDIERWLLKALCGLVCSGNLRFDGCDVPIPREWIEILFSRSGFSKDQGLYVCSSSRHEFQGPRGLVLQPITRNGKLTGFGLHVSGFELVFSMSGMPERQFDGRDFVYRPLEIYETGQNFEKSICFSWEDTADLGTISFKYSVKE